MAGDRRINYRRLSNWLVLILLAAFLAGMIFPVPSKRKFPDREPIYFWHMWTTEWQVVINDICTAFNESQDEHEVIPISTPKSIASSKFLLTVTGGDPPDCMAQWNQIVPQFAERELIQPINPFMTKAELDDFIESAHPISRKIAFYKDELFCMPLALDIRALYFRLDQMDEAGLIPDGYPKIIRSREDYEKLKEIMPRSLEELSEWGNRLNIIDGKGRFKRLGYMPDRFHVFAPIYQGGFYDTETNTFTINTEENRRALSFLVDFRESLGPEKIISFESSLSDDHGADWPFILGKRSIAYHGQWRVQQLEKFAPDVPYMTAPIPAPELGGREKSGWVFGNFMIIPKGSRNPKGAWEFIKFWTGINNPEKAAEFYARAGWIPPSPRIAETEHYQAYVRDHPQYQVFVDLAASPNLDTPPPIPFQLFLFDKIKQADEAATRGSLTPEEALLKLEREIEDRVKRWKEAQNEE